MNIDPVLNGTTFAAALEGAARDEEAKRAARAAEMSGTSVQPQARALAEALRGHNPTPVIASPDAAAHAEKRMQWVGMAQQSQAAPSIDDAQSNEPKANSMTDLLTLSESQLKILAMGMEEEEFKLGAGLSGRVKTPLVEEELIISASKGRYSITDKGRARYMAETASTDDPEESGVDLSDPALQVGVDPEVKRWQDVAADRLTKNNQLNKTLDELGAIADDLRSKLKQYESGDETLDYYRALIAPALALMEADRYAYGLAEYVQHLHDKAHSIDSRDVNEWLNGMNVSLGDIDTLNEMKAADGYEGRIRDYVADLRQKDGPSYRAAMDMILALSQMMLEDNADVPLVDYVAQMRTRDIQGNQWYGRVVVPLIELIVAGSKDLSPVDLMDDPARIVRYVKTIEQCLADMDRIADERAQTIDQHSATIESLRREIETYESRFRVWQDELNAVKRHDLAVQILDDLCHLLPEVDDYRAGREASEKALQALKAGRS